MEHVGVGEPGGLEEREGPREEGGREESEVVEREDGESPGPRGVGGPEEGRRRGEEEGTVGEVAKSSRGELRTGRGVRGEGSEEVTEGVWTGSRGGEDVGGLS